MADLIVSRIQNRRGKQIDLPQPLRPGEYGWCVDTGKLFIGGDQSTPKGVQIYPGYYTIAQSMITNQLIEIDMSGVGGFDLVAFQAWMLDPNNFPSVSLPSGDKDVLSENVLYDAEDMVVIVGLDLTQQPEQANYITDISAYGPGASPVVPAYVVTTNGSFSTNTHGIANAISAVMNSLSATFAIATTKLNIEVLTEFSEAAVNVLFLPALFYLPSTDAYPTIGTFTDFPLGLEYDVSEADTLHLEFACHGDDTTNRLHMSGSMKISSIVTSAETTLMDEFIESRDPNMLNGVIQFQAVFVGPNTVKIQYSHNFPMELTFSSITRRWLSF